MKLRKLIVLCVIPLLFVCCSEKKRVSNREARGQTPLKLEFSTYLGGELHDWVWGMTLDTDGNIYICGTTGSIEFPSKGPIIGTLSPGSWDSFITKIDPSGQEIIYSILIGASADITAEKIVVDDHGNVFDASFFV